MRMPPGPRLPAPSRPPGAPRDGQALRARRKAWRSGLAAECRGRRDRVRKLSVDKTPPAPVTAPTRLRPDAPPEPERAAPVSTRANWRWRPLGGDTPEARARAERLVPREFLELSDRKLTAYAKANGASGKIPGIEIYDAGSVVVR